jgi:hypothetical protein
MLKVIKSRRYLSFSLKSESLCSLYKKSVFYNLKLDFLISRKDSFTNLLEYRALFDFSKRFKLNRVKVILVYNNFLCLDSSQKYTMLKPKFKTFLHSFSSNNITNKECLMFYGRFYFLNFFTSHMLQNFLFSFLRAQVKIFNSSKTASFLSYFNFFRKLIFFSNLDYYSYYKLFRLILSKYQKKINFVQFNIFLKKYKFFLL